MSIARAAGQSYTGAQVTEGMAVLSADGTTYTYTNQVTLSGETVTINSVNGTSVSFTYTDNFGNTTNATGTVLANNANGFVFSGPFGAVTERFYVTNLASQQPASNGSVSVPAESAAGQYYAACYAAGTLIRTETGDVAVEDLSVGDKVVTVTGEAKPVRWIGNRSYNGRFFSANQQVWPIRFRAGSLGLDAAGAAVPSRDLLVSPRHSMLIDGVLVPAELLVNGSTIVRDGSARQVTYYHVELPQHDAIWAENAASESFVDDGSRFVFHNAGTFGEMYPGEAAAVEPVFCAPRVEDGEALHAIRRKLEAGNEVRIAA